MICSKCQKEIAPDAKFCNFCGEPSVVAQGVIPVSSGTRFLNLLVDSIFLFIIAFVIIFVITVFTKTEVSQSSKSDDALGYIMGFLYFFGSEALWHRSPGKFITGTKVVDQSGGVPTTGQIALRALGRYIPVDFLFFFGKNPIGLHDRISKTRVVKA